MTILSSAPLVPWKFRTWDLYDEMNRIKQTTGFLNEPTRYDYDFAGNMTVMTDSKGAQYITSYDELNRKKSTIYPPDASQLSRREIWHYDIAGNLAFYKNPAGHYKHFVYDERNRQRRSYWRDLDQPGEPNRGIGLDTETFLDAASRVLEIKTNGGETIVAYGYDAANRKLWEDQTLLNYTTRRVQTDPDLDGNRTTLAVAGVYSLSYDYTGRQQLWHINSGGSAWLAYTYDKNGNLKKRQHVGQGGDGTNFWYDAVNRVTLCEQTGHNDISFSRSHYQYEPLSDNVKSVSREEQANRGERFEYDDANQLESVSYNATIEPGPTPAPTPTPPGQGQQVDMPMFDPGDQYNYYPANSIGIGIWTGTDGAQIYYTIDESTPSPNNGTLVVGTGAVIQGPGPFRLKARAFKNGWIDSEIATADYYWDGEQGTGEAPPMGPMAPVTRTVLYDNDPLNRRSVNDNGVLTNYVRNGMNQYTAVGSQTPLYDGNFNLSSQEGWSYVYDGDNRLVRAQTATNQSANFEYDGLGRCVKRTINGAGIVFTYDGWKPIAEWNAATGTIQAWNVYGPGADEIVAGWKQNIGVHHYHQDGMGHVAFVLSGELNYLLEKYSYDAFGRPRIMDPEGNPRATSLYGNRFMFTGREYLSVLGIYDYRHRVYHPGLGRFVQVDPIGFKGDPMNLYRYCGANPINRSDPMGLLDFQWASLMWFQSSSLASLQQFLERKSDEAAGMGDGGGGGAENRQRRKSMHERSVAMLAEETRRGNINQTGVITDGPPYRVGPVGEKKVPIDHNNINRGYKDISLEEVRWRGPKDQKIIIVHYHSRGGKVHGEPTQDHDIKMLRQGPMYFTNRDWAQSGKYLILRNSRETETHFDDRIIPQE